MLKFTRSHYYYSNSEYPSSNCSIGYLNEEKNPKLIERAYTLKNSDWRFAFFKAHAEMASDKVAKRISLNA